MAAAEKILDQKVGKLTLLDGALIGASKIATEMIFTQVPWVGNTTFKSGLIKVAGAVALSYAFGNNRWLSYISTGILLDGMEDLVYAAKVRYFGSGSSSGAVTGGNSQQAVSF